MSDGAPGRVAIPPGIAACLARATGYVGRYRLREPTLGPQPHLPIVVITCMDARIVPGNMLGTDEGGIHVLRNAGGVVTDDVIRSLIVSQRKLGTSEVLVMQHTGCGMSTFDDEDFLDELEADSGVRPAWSPAAFRDTEASVRQGVARLRACPWLPHTDGVVGAVFDVRGGEIRVVA